MAIIVGRRDASPLISSAGPVAVPDKTPTEEFAQGIKAASAAYDLGKEVVADTSKVVTLGVQMARDTPEEARAKHAQKLKEREEQLYQQYKSIRDREDQQALDDKVPYNAIEQMGEGGKIPDLDRAFELEKAGKNDEALALYEHTMKTAGQGMFPEVTAQVGQRIERLKRVTQRGIQGEPSNPFLEDTWEKARQATRDRRISGGTPDQTLHNLAREKAKRDVGPAPVSWRDIKNAAVIAAAEKDPAVRKQMLLEAQASLEAAGGLGVPVDSWTDIFTGNHLRKAHGELREMFKMSALEASQLTTEEVRRDLMKQETRTKKKEADWYDRFAKKKIEGQDADIARTKEQTKNIEKERDVMISKIASMDASTKLTLEQLRQLPLNDKAKRKLLESRTELNKGKLMEVIAKTIEIPKDAEWNRRYKKLLGEAAQRNSRVNVTNANSLKLLRGAQVDILKLQEENFNEDAIVDRIYKLSRNSSSGMTTKQQLELKNLSEMLKVSTKRIKEFKDVGLITIVNGEPVLDPSRHKRTQKRKGLGSPGAQRAINEYQKLKGRLKVYTEGLSESIKESQKAAMAANRDIAKLMSKSPPQKAPKKVTKEQAKNAFGKPD